MTAIPCPCCGSTALDALYPTYSGPCVTSDMEVLADSGLDNRLCQGCGLVFNARGTRGGATDFYRDAYKLMIRSAEAGIQSFAGGGAPVSQAQRTFEVLARAADLPATGALIEVGAGKGDFLEHFAAAFPAWSISASEPSAAHEHLARRFPGAGVARGGYRDVAPGAPVDLVVALGVLEHVEDPLDMLRWANGRLREGGLFYVRVPNFAVNPNDLFCADHLSKLTPATLEALAAAAGFAVVTSQTIGVPIFLCLRKTGPGGGPIASAYEANKPIAEANARASRGAMEAVLAGRREAMARGEGFAVFGLGASGLFAPLYGGFDAGDIAAYLDENRTVWGATVNGRPVRGLDAISELGLRHVALAISPVYFDQVREKLRPHGVRAYAANDFAA